VNALVEKQQDSDSEISIDSERKIDRYNDNTNNIYSTHSNIDSKTGKKKKHKRYGKKRKGADKRKTILKHKLNNHEG
jgi:hypothetical protein